MRIDPLKYKVTVWNKYIVWYWYHTSGMLQDFLLFYSLMVSLSLDIIIHTRCSFFYLIRQFIMNISMSISTIPVGFPHKAADVAIYSFNIAKLAI